MNTAVNFKALVIEGDYQFNDTEEAKLYNYIINSFFRAREVARKEVTRRIGIVAGESKPLMFGTFKIYSNEAEIGVETAKIFKQNGYLREDFEGGYTITTPEYKMTVSFGEDFGGSECVKQIANISIVKI